jgi:hypothetical protein
MVALLGSMTATRTGPTSETTEQPRLRRRTRAAESGAEDIPDTIQHRAVGHIPGIPEVGDPPQDARAGPEKAAGCAPGMRGKRLAVVLADDEAGLGLLDRTRAGGRGGYLGITGISRR